MLLGDSGSTGKVAAVGLRLSGYPLVPEQSANRTVSLIPLGCLMYMLGASRIDTQNLYDVQSKVSLHMHYA